MHLLRQAEVPPAPAADSRDWSWAVALLEEERLRLARELHDETGQIATLTLSVFDACLTEMRAEAHPLVEQLDDFRRSLLTAVRDLHRLVYDLRPPMLSELGFVPTLRWHVQQFADQHQIVATFETVTTTDLSDVVEMTLYRVVQEALTNVARHAMATTVRVTIDASPQAVVVTVADDGRGFDPRPVCQGPVPHFGLVGMRERVRLLGGTLAIQTAPGQGTVVEVRLPPPAVGRSVGLHPWAPGGRQTRQAG